MTTKPEEANGSRKRKPRPQGLEDWRQWPNYEAATLGLRNYWYPTVWARDLGDKPQGIKLLGENIMLIREGSEVYALHDRCPHRGVKLSEGKKVFPGTVSCPYHGWTFDVTDGRLCAALPDGPDSPIVGNVSVRSYPTEEALGLVWVFVGDEKPTPLRDQLPEELFTNDYVAGGRITPGRYGNWRFAVENGFDEGHARYLHRDQAFMMFRQMPGWARTKIVADEDGDWLFRVQESVEYESDFPGLGKWPRRKITQVAQRKMTPGEVGKRLDPTIRSLNLPGHISVRLPGLLRVAWTTYLHFEWYVPEDENHHRYVQYAVRFKTGPSDFAFRLRYWTYIRWLFHGKFTGRDAWMVEEMDAPPERLFRPDVSITRWRRLVESAFEPKQDKKKPAPAKKP